MLIYNFQLEENKMSSDVIRQMWPKFDDLIAKAESNDIKVLIEALKLHAEMMNLRLAGIEQSSGAQMRSAAPQTTYPPIQR
jgi:hypothetical protein